MISLSQPANLILAFHDLQFAVTHLFVKMMNGIYSKVYKQIDKPRLQLLVNSLKESIDNLDMDKYKYNYCCRKLLTY